MAENTPLEVKQAWAMLDAIAYIEKLEEVLQRIAAPDPLAHPATERDYFSALARSVLKRGEFLPFVYPEKGERWTPDNGKS
jgi:hypothetical protein